MATPSDMNQMMINFEELDFSIYSYRDLVGSLVHFDISTRPNIALSEASQYLQKLRIIRERAEK